MRLFQRGADKDEIRWIARQRGREREQLLSCLRLTGLAPPAFLPPYPPSSNPSATEPPASLRALLLCAPSTPLFFFSLSCTGGREEKEHEANLMQQTLDPTCWILLSGSFK